MAKPNLYKFPGYFFEVLVPTLFQSSFGNQRLELEFDTATGVYVPPAGQGIEKRFG